MIIPDGKIVIRASIINGEWSLSQTILGGGCELITQEKCAVCPGNSLRLDGCFSNGDRPVIIIIKYIILICMNT